MDWGKGLTEKEAEQARSIYGSNEVRVDEGRVWLRILINQVKSPLIYILLIASFISFVLGNSVDATVIFLAVLINTVFGFFQEYKAEKSVEALAKILTPRARVKRGDEWITVDAGLLVPGDVVKLTIGWKVPADGLLISSDPMFISEAVLTGESMPVQKKSWKDNGKWRMDNGEFEKIETDFKGFMGTVVEKGIGEMLVVRTGEMTKIGGIAKVVREKGMGRTPLQKRLDRLTELLALLVSVVAGVVFVYGLMTGKSFLEFLNTSVALAVSAIPEGLVVGLTVILAVGMNRIMKRKAIVRGLMAAETLGSVSTICLDKTGTITEGKMTAVGAVTDLNENVDEQLEDEGVHDKEKMIWLIEGALLCNDQRDPLEISMRDWAALRLEMIAGLNVIEGYQRTSELSFDHTNKYIVTRHVLSKKYKGESKKVEESNKEYVEFINGAPEIVLEKSKLSEEIRAGWMKMFGELGIKGYRLVALAYKKLSVTEGPKKVTRDDVGDYEWLGLVIFTDPVRGGVAESLDKAENAGIKLKVITGDYKETAWAAMREAKMVEKVMVNNEIVMMGEEFLTLSEGDRDEKILNSTLFARISPDQKLIIVETLQESGETVAMMGDGVNDVPALKKADIGVVVESASDLAREVSDLILLDNNFDTVLAAVEEGRGIFDNLRKVILYLLSDSFSAIIVVIVSIYLDWPLPLLASQILWINLVSDGFPYMALTVEPKEDGLLARKPIKKKEPIIDRKRIALVAVISLVAGLLTLIIFGYNYYFLGKDLVTARTLAFAIQGISSLVYVFSVRSLSKPIWRDNFFKNPLLIVGVIGGLVLQFMAIYTPALQIIFGTVAISWFEWINLFLGGGILILVIEMVKYLFFRND